MESETHPVETKENKPKRGLKVFNYVVPWWVVILVILVALYFAHEKGYLAGILGDSKPVVNQVVELKGPVVHIEPESAPEQVKRLFNQARW